LERVKTWPKEAQEAAFDALTSIEEEIYGVPIIAEDIIRVRDDRDVAASPHRTV
jgi:hypothetical protein